MKIDYKILKDIFTDYGYYGLLVLTIVVLFFFPDNAKKWAGWFYHFLGYYFKIFRKRAIRFRLESSCTKSLKNFSKELPDIEIPDLSIEWIKSDENLDTIFKEGKAIVKLNFDKDQTKNILKATTVYVKDAFLKHSKPYMSEKLKKALDFSITRKILLNINKNKKNILSQFIEDNISETEQITEQISFIEEIDDNGLLTRIFIRELDYWGTKLAGRLPKSEHKEEADNFLNFIYDIVIREPEDYTELQFTKNNLKIGVLLVAKKDTYLSYGLEPYLRRIKLGLAQGIETNYLLARDDKVSILKKVATELIQTGNFILINEPREFKDNKNRNVICYALRINKDSVISETIQTVSSALKEKEELVGVITRISENGLKIDLNGIEGYVGKNNLSIIKVENPFKYFSENTTISIIPIEIKANGIIEYTLKGTKSDPNVLLKNQFEIGKTIFGKVTYCDDSFIKIDIGNEKIEGIAFRNKLTYSRYIFLHKKFEIGNDYEFIIEGYYFEKNRIILSLKNLSDPWEKLRLRKKELVSFIPYKKGEKVFVGEIIEGVEAILPYSELGWFNSEIISKKNQIKTDNTYDCFVKEINIPEKRIVLTLKDYDKNPYKKYVEKHINEIVEFKAQKIDEFGGIIGITYDGYNIYIPKYEQSWNETNYNYRINKKYKVSIKSVDKYFNRLLGSFKPILKHPLDKFSEKYIEGQALKALRISEKYDWGCIININFNGKVLQGLLFKGDISNIAYINSCRNLFENISQIPLIIKSIDKESNRIVLSLKLLLKNNLKRLETIDYRSSFDAIILSNHYNNHYVVLLKGIWLEGILETDNRYNTGDSLRVRPASINDERIILIEE